MILHIIIFITILGIYLYLGTYIFEKNIKENVNQNLTTYFYIAYFLIFIILCNTFLLNVFYGKIQNKRGPVGPIGIRGNLGKMGENGLCEYSCTNKECYIKIVELVQNKYNKLLKDIDNITNPINIKLDILHPKTKKVYKTQLKNNMLNNMLEGLCESKQYKKAINDSNKTTDQVNNYIYNIVEKWIEIIYKSLPKEERTSLTNKNNFFTNNYLNEENTSWIDDNNPFDEISKYDIYEWGRNRTFKPKHIRIDNNPINVNYVPQDSKPPLKILYSNNYQFIYDNSYNSGKYTSIIIIFNKKYIPFQMYYINKSEVKFELTSKNNNNKTWQYKDSNDKFILFSEENNNKINTNISNKSTKELELQIKNLTNDYPINNVSIWKNQEPIKYRKETYYPVSNLVIGPNKDYQSTTTKEIVDPNEKYYKVKTYNYTGIQDKKENINKQLEFKNPKKSTILVTGDVENPDEYYKVWDNSNTYEQNNVSIWRPICPNGYESLSDVAVKGFNEPKIDTIKCVPKLCVEKNTQKEETLFTTFDNNELIGYSNNNNKTNPINKNSFNAFRYKDKDDSKNIVKGFKNNLYTIKDSCITNKDSVTKPVEEKYGRIGLGWNGRPLRNPKYSIFSYLVQMPEAIISNKATNFKYYIIHTELYNIDKKPDANFKTSAKNQYYILVLNFRTNKYDRCLSTNGTTEIVRTTLRSELESYWELEPINNNDFDEIRLKSAKTGNYLYHDRNANLRRDLVKNRVFEKQKPLNNETKTDNSMIFVNIKSSFGTNIQTALENGEPRLEEKYYKNNEKNKTNKYKDDYQFEKRGIHK
jgi:hypothetical protein